MPGSDLPTLFPKEFRKYKVIKILGKGGFGTVYLVQNKNGKKYVLKVSKKMHKEYLVAEYNAGRAILHPCIVQPLELFDEGDFTCLLFEYIPGSTLTEYLARNNLSHQVKMMLMQQLILAIAHLHQVCKIVHLDLKPDNIMVVIDRNGFPVVKIIDFGLACPIKDLAPYARGTPMYMAPEVAMGECMFDEKADIWSLGKILAYICTGRNIFLSGNYPIMTQIMFLVNTITPPIPDEMRKDSNMAHALQLCEACLVIDPTYRASAMDLLKICSSQKIV